ncbi:MAG: SufD family Fe-S cluster assembly protein [Cyanobacteriota bacterium]
MSVTRDRWAEVLTPPTLPRECRESWRFTDLAPLKALDPGRLAPRAGAPITLPAPAAGVVRLCLGPDGLSFSPDPTAIPWPAGVSCCPVPTPSAEATVLAERLAAVLPGPALGLRLAAGARLRLELLVQPDLPLAVAAPRLWFDLGAEASLELALGLRGPADSLLVTWLGATLAGGAELLVGQRLEGADSAVALVDDHVEQDPGSRYHRTAVVRGWGLARLEPQVCQTSGQASTTFRDLALVRGQATVDLHSRVRFEGPEGQLDQLHRALVDDAGQSVFNGVVQVPQQAQRTDAAQLSRHLLLSPRGRVDTIPQLEIVADDVRCSHGATVSSLSDDELFYLQSRGIDRALARRLLTRGFCRPILDDLPPLAAAWPAAELLP